MDSGCYLGCFNCCFFNCLNSFSLSIFEIISSIIGIIVNSLLMTQTKKIIDSSKFVFSINIINISFYSIGTGTSTFLAILKKLEKLNQGWFYIFGVRSSKINSIISKILVLLNIIGLIYLISFTEFITRELSFYHTEKLFKNYYIDHIGPGKEIEYVLKYINMDSHCKKYNCSSEELLSANEEEKDNFKDVYLAFIYSLISCFMLYFNGESFASDSKRIEFLSSGKLALEFRPIEVISSICNREKSCSLLNPLFCYKATLTNIEVLIGIFSAINIFFSIFGFLILSKNGSIQSDFLDMGITFFIIPFVVSIFCFINIICWERCCSCCCTKCKISPACSKKIRIIISLILIIISVPVLILNLPLSVGSLNGKIKYKTDCTIFNIDNIDYKELYNKICHEESYNKYLLITLKPCSIKLIILVFSLYLIQIILFIYLGILIFSHIQRVIADYNNDKRAYEAVIFLVENNGNKINIDDIEIVCETVKTTKNEQEKKKEYINYIYKRKILEHNV